LVLNKVLDEEHEAMLSYSYLKTIFSYCEELNFSMKEALEEKDTISQYFVLARDQVFSHPEFIDSLKKYLKAKSTSQEEKEEFKETIEFDQMERTIRYILSVFVLVGDQTNIEGKEWQLRSLFILVRLLNQSLRRN
jgi:hypothetical protein